MTEIIREYATGVRTIIVVSGLFLILFSGIRVYDRFSEYAYASTSDGMYYGGDRTMEYAGKEIPQIKVSQALEKDNIYKVEDVFRNANGGDAFTSVRIMELWHMNDSGEYEDSYDCYNMTDKTIGPLKVGIYKAKVGVVDTTGATNTQWMYFITEE